MHNSRLQHYSLSFNDYSAHHEAALKALRKAIELDTKIFDLIPPELIREVLDYDLHDPDNLFNFNDKSSGVDFNGFLAVQTNI